MLMPRDFPGSRKSSTLKGRTAIFTSDRKGRAKLHDGAEAGLTSWDGSSCCERRSPPPRHPPVQAGQERLCSGNNGRRNKLGDSQMFLLTKVKGADLLWRRSRPGGGVLARLHAGLELLQILCWNIRDAEHKRRHKMSQAEKKSLIKNRNYADSQRVGAPAKSEKHRNILFGSTVPSGGRILMNSSF